MDGAGGLSPFEIGMSRTVMIEVVPFRGRFLLIKKFLDNGELG